MTHALWSVVCWTILVPPVINLKHKHNCRSGQIYTFTEIKLICKAVSKYSSVNQLLNPYKLITQKDRMNTHKNRKDMGKKTKIYVEPEKSPNSQYNPEQNE